MKALNPEGAPLTNLQLELVKLLPRKSRKKI
jgi:hypothetical protein